MESSFSHFPGYFFFSQSYFLFVTSKIPCYDYGESGVMQEGKFKGTNNEKRLNKIIDVKAI